MASKKEGLRLGTLTPEDRDAPSITESFEADAHHHAGCMQSTWTHVPFPKLLSVETYVPWTIPFRSAQDPIETLTDTEKVWIDVFRRSIEPFTKRAANDPEVEGALEKAAKFAEKYTTILDDFAKDPKSHGGPPNPVNLCRLREVALIEAGFTDIFKQTKSEENDKAIELLPAHLKLVDAVEDLGERIDMLVKGVLAGNIFDLGANNSAHLVEGEGLSFEKSFNQLLPRPWVVDDAEEFKKAWMDRTWQKVVIFVDNSGADLVLGVLPLARELVRQGATVVIAANDKPSINDVTYSELLLVVQKLQLTVEDEIFSNGIDSGRILIVNSGSDVPVADLANVSPELAFAADDAELVIMEGMGRSIESNLNATFTCDKLNIGMVKHKEVADFLGGREYDGVVKYTPGDYVPTPSRKTRFPTQLSSA